jgi:hypothetical protein
MPPARDGDYHGIAVVGAALCRPHTGWGLPRDCGCRGGVIPPARDGNDHGIAVVEAASSHMHGMGTTTGWGRPRDGVAVQARNDGGRSPQ